MVEWSADQAMRPAARRVFPLKFVVAGAIVLVAIGYLVLTGLSSASVYYLTVGELQGQAAGSATGGIGTRPVRVSGDVVPGSIARDGSTVRFAIADGGGSLPVIYSGVIPDIFGDNMQVVVEGRTGPDGTFQATNLFAKCPSKFEAAVTDHGPLSIVPSEARA